MRNRRKGKQPDTLAAVAKQIARMPAPGYWREAPQTRLMRGLIGIALMGSLIVSLFLWPEMAASAPDKMTWLVYCVGFPMAAVLLLSAAGTQLFVALDTFIDVVSYWGGMILSVLAVPLIVFSPAVALWTVLMDDAGALAGVIGGLALLFALLGAVSAGPYVNARRKLSNLHRRRMAEKILFFSILASGFIVGAMCMRYLTPNQLAIALSALVVVVVAITGWQWRRLERIESTRNRIRDVLRDACVTLGQSAHVHSKEAAGPMHASQDAAWTVMKVADVLKHGSLRPSGTACADGGTLIVLEYLYETLIADELLLRVVAGRYPDQLSAFHALDSSARRRAAYEFMLHLHRHLDDGRLVNPRRVRKT